MAALVKVRYVGPFDEVEVPSAGFACKRGEVVEVFDRVANGTPATEDHPGTSGLLAQTGVWESVKDTKAQEA